MAIWTNFFENVYNAEEGKMRYTVNPRKLPVFLFFLSTYW
jgi:hypothetical protein